MTPDRPDGAELLALEGVSKSFGAVRALRDVSLRLQAGEVHALAGENGAGKSTLIKALAGVHRPESGTLLLDGRPVTWHGPADARDAGVAVIYQEPTLFPDLSVAENLFMGRQPRRSLGRVDHTAARAAAGALFARLGVHLDPEQPARGLSIADQQLVEIAKALSLDARVLIMDEPTAALTGSEVARLFGVVRTLRDQGAAVLFVSHRIEEIFALCDRVTTLRDGAVVAVDALCGRRGGNGPTEDGSGPGEGGRRLAGDGGRLAKDGCGPVEDGRGRPVEDGGGRTEEGRGSAGSGGGLTEDGLVRRMVGRDLDELYPKQRVQPGGVALDVRRLTREGVFTDVSFTVRSGEIVGLAGLVGAGRSEVARAVFGVDRWDAGSVHVDGRALPGGAPTAAMAAGVALVPEDRRAQGLVLRMSIERNIGLTALRTARRRGLVSRRAERARARDWAARLQLRYARLTDPAGTLSGGNQQKVVLAKWLATAPKVLIVDEPTRGIDVGTKAEVHRLLSQLAADGVAVLMISSDLPEILGMADRVLVMHEGRLTADLPRATATEEAVLAAATGRHAADCRPAADTGRPAAETGRSAATGGRPAT